MNTRKRKQKLPECQALEEVSDQINGYDQKRFSSQPRSSKQASLISLPAGYSKVDAASSASVAVAAATSASPACGLCKISGWVSSPFSQDLIQMPCSHVLCLHCLQQLIANRNRQCVFCKMQLSITSKDLGLLN